MQVDQHRTMSWSMYGFMVSPNWIQDRSEPTRLGLPMQGSTRFWVSSEVFLAADCCLSQDSSSGEPFFRGLVRVAWLRICRCWSRLGRWDGVVTMN